MMYIFLFVIIAWLLTLELRQHNIRGMINDTQQIINEAVAKVRNLK